MKAVAVVIPACDEERVLPAALAAADAAARYVDCPVTTIVVCDSCVDHTAEMAHAAGAHVLETTVGCAGGARRAGVARARELLADVAPEGLWVASTDADSIVRADWLTTHLDAARDGWDAYTGEVVVLDWDGWSEAMPDAYERRYRQPGRRPPVHGANLGVRLDAYLAVGGFPPVACGEDELLVTRLIEAGYAVLASPCAPVHTSARRVARVRGGFSTYLSELEQVEAWVAGEQPDDDFLLS